MGNVTAPTRLTLRGSVAMKWLIGFVLLGVSFIAVTHHVATEPGVDAGASAFRAVHTNTMAQTTQASPAKLLLEVSSASSVVGAIAFAVVVAAPRRRQTLLQTVVARRGPPAFLPAL